MSHRPGGGPHDFSCCDEGRIKYNRRKKNIKNYACAMYCWNSHIKTTTKNILVHKNPGDNPEVRYIYRVSVDGFWLRIVP